MTKRNTMPFDPPIMIADWCDVGKVTISVLPDDVLLGVFDWYVDEGTEVEAWHTLVHVCRRWRTLVFASPRRLNLRIACTIKTPVREMLDAWPALPIVISGYCRSSTCLDSIKAALEHNDRVCQIKLNARWPKEFAEVLAALEAPFPVLTDLDLQSIGLSNPILLDPVKFLGGSTQLRSLSFTGIPVSRLPELLSFFTNLRVVNLHLNNNRITSFFVTPCNGHCTVRVGQTRSTSL
jgi:hypothetical protein